MFGFKIPKFNLKTGNGNRLPIYGQSPVKRRLRKHYTKTGLAVQGKSRFSIIDMSDWP
jgi:hypothetical protein